MFRKFNIWLFVAAVVVLPLSVFAVVNWYEKTVQKLPVLVSKDHRITDFKLTNQHGGTTTTKNWENKIVVADFFFTRCPSVCPKMTSSLKKVQAATANNNDVFIASFTVDPENDSTAVLQKYVNRFQINENNWHLLTGSKKDIYRLARKSFLVIATDGDGGPDDFIHSDLLILVDKQKRIRGYYEGTVEKEVQQLIKDIKKLENEK